MAATDLQIQVKKAVQGLLMRKTPSPLTTPIMQKVQEEKTLTLKHQRGLTNKEVTDVLKKMNPAECFSLNAIHSVLEEQEETYREAVDSIVNDKMKKCDRNLKKMKSTVADMYGPDSLPKAIMDKVSSLLAVSIQPGADTPERGAVKALQLVQKMKNQWSSCTTQEGKRLAMDIENVLRDTAVLRCIVTLSSDAMKDRDAFLYKCALAWNCTPGELDMQSLMLCYTKLDILELGGFSSNNSLHKRHAGAKRAPRQSCSQNVQPVQPVQEEWQPVQEEWHTVQPVQPMQPVQEEFHTNHNEYFDAAMWQCGWQAAMETGAYIEEACISNEGHPFSYFHHQHFQ